MVTTEAAPPATNGVATEAWPLSEDNINPKVKQAQYAVRGQIVIRAKEIESELKAGVAKPFKHILYCNIGNPQQLGQKPITFFRQVLSIMDYPGLLDYPDVDKIFPSDVIARAKHFLASIPGGTGAYSDSRGATVCREDVCKGIERRDGFPADPESIFMTDGASQSVHTMMRLLLRCEHDAILTPIPQYPLYSATLCLYGGTLLPYYLDEDAGWGLNIEDVKRQTANARAEGYTVRGLVVINPGNPTGQVLNLENQKEIVKFCKEQGIVLMADEVYQDNVYAEGKEFNSFKKVVRLLGDEYNDFPLASMHSISKGFYGECGRRGGYTEFVGFPAEVMAQLYKLASINLCSNLNGQICMALMMNPPQPGDPSYKLYAEEKEAQLDSLKRRAALVNKTLNALEGVTCNNPEGALYAMPRIRLPAAAVEEAKKQGVAPDFLYCMTMLEETGIVTVPGSGFKQVDGTYHFRTTFLPPESDMEEVSTRMTDFHANFLKKYGSPAA